MFKNSVEKILLPKSFNTSVNQFNDAGRKELKIQDIIIDDVIEL